MGLSTVAVDVYGQLTMTTIAALRERAGVSRLCAGLPRARASLCLRATFSSLFLFQQHRVNTSPHISQSLFSSSEVVSSSGSYTHKPLTIYTPTIDSYRVATHPSPSTSQRTRQNAPKASSSSRCRRSHSSSCKESQDHHQRHRRCEIHVSQHVGEA